MGDSAHRLPPARSHSRGGSLLDVAPPGADPVLRHAAARAEREERRSRAIPETARPRGPVRDLLPGWLGRATRPAGSTPEPLTREEAMDGSATPALRSAKPTRRSSVTASRPARKSGRLVAAMLIGAVLGAGIAVFWPKSYVATAELLIDPASVMGGGAVPGSASAVVDNQIHILKSGTMLSAVSERLNLAADPEFNGVGGGLGKAMAGLGALLGGGDVVEERGRRAVESLAGSVTADRADASTVIGVSARTTDPEKSALVANTLAELYLTGAGNTSDGGIRSQRLSGLSAEAEEARRAVETFRAQNGLIGADVRQSGGEAALRLDERLAEARARTLELNARAASTRDANVDSVVTGSLPEQYASPTLTRLRSLYAQQKQQVDRLSARLGPRHPELLSAQAELDGAREEIAGELRRVASSLQTELTRAVQQEQELAAQLAQMKSSQGEMGDELVELRELERNAEIRSVAYEQALRDSQTGIGSSAARMISRAAPPRNAATPSLPLMTLAGALAGLAAGIALTARRRDGIEVDADSEDGERGAEDAARPADRAHSRLEQAADHAAEAIARRHDDQYRAWAEEEYGDEPLRPFLPGRNPDRHLRDDDYDHDAFIEDREDAAIEEIRQSLREFRAVVEDLAESRQADRRYGT